MRNLKKLAIAAGFAALFSLPASSAVFVVAHPDDHILLMGPNLIGDVVGGYPTVIVMVTAGDAGNGHGDKTTAGFNSGQYNAFGNQYYRVRLQAHMSALERWIPGASSGSERPWTETTENFGTLNPRVEKWALGNVVLYHLNLPDAGAANGLTVLQTLTNPVGTVVSDITGTNRYTFDSLKSTIQQIISRNNRSTPTVVINRPRSTFNSEHADHPDHTQVGYIVEEAIKVEPYRCVWQAAYRGYQIGAYPVNAQNMLNSQRAGYELLHTILAQRGNVVPYTPGDVVSNPTWMQTSIVPGTTNRQYGAMDGFHSGFYGRNYYDGSRLAQRDCAF